jgi:uncharacterized protein YbjT (DUF2867 family)
VRLVVVGGSGTVGRYVVEAGRDRGHQVVVASRATGVDVVSGAGLDAAVAGADAVIDAGNIEALRRDRATAYFTGAVGRIHDAGWRAGVGRLVVLSIVGVDRVPGFGYYEAKVAHEEAALAGPLPTAVLRATQFHELAGQLVRRTRRGPVAVVPRMRTQPVAARTVGRALVDLAEGDATGLAGELGGPEVADTVDLARRLVARLGWPVRVLPVPSAGAGSRAMRSGALLPGEGARLEGPTFDEWLGGTDPDALAG